MANVESATCTNCGTSFAVGIPRCPFCGRVSAASAAALPIVSEHLPSLAAVAPLTPSRSSKSPSDAAAPSASPLRSGPDPKAMRLPVRGTAMGVAIVSLLGVLTFARWLLRSPPDEPHARAPVAPARASLAAARSPLDDMTRVDPSELFPRAKKQALAWNARARLASISAAPVVSDKVDLTEEHGQIAYVFVADDPLQQENTTAIITVTKAGPEMQTSHRGPTASFRGALPKAVAEPNCVFGAAIKAARASGLPAGELKVRYDDRALPGRALWIAGPLDGQGDERAIDGQTCAIVTIR